VALAYLSRWYFEEPFLRLKNEPNAPAQTAEMPAALALKARAAS
jgi:hypothetical protein